jgi:hypothetical protein
VRSLIALNRISIAALFHGRACRVLFFHRFQSFPHDVMMPAGTASVVQFEEESI